MSKLIDELSQLSQVGLQPMGFRAAQAVPQKPRILLIASLPQADVDRLADYVAGADAGLLQIPELSSGIKTIQHVCQAMSDIPWGGWLGDVGNEGIEQMVEAGCDFVVFPAANTSLAILQNDEVGKILEVEASLSEGLLKAVDDLPVDAVLIAGEQGKDYFLTWHHLMLFRRSADLLTKPLLVSVPSDVAAHELQALWEAGVSGVVVEAGVRQPTGRLQELRQIIDKLAFPLPRKQRKVEPLLPPIGEETETVSEEEED
ncbi:MAG: hypothetical protein OEZ00_00190 [Dehalococcoidia bacterium]|nr:hypothetical protein [Dehalococcoidia bacterium]